MTSVRQAARARSTYLYAIASRVRWCSHCALWLVELRYRCNTGRPVWRAINGFLAQFEAEQLKARLGALPSTSYRRKAST